MKKENDILEETLSIAEKDYSAAYRFLLKEYEAESDNYGPQTLYFLACLAGGADLPADALGWLKTAVIDNGWWYRPEVLVDDDLAAIENDPEFVRLKSVSDSRYFDAVSKSKAVFSLERKSADNLFLAVHGNTQNGQTAREDWSRALGESSRWQLETIQSAEPDGYGTYRWSYDEISYLPVAEAIEKAKNEGYEKIVCGGFSAGCDMLLRAVLFTQVSCDSLILQSPWIPIFESREKELTAALARKKIGLRIFCGECDGDCLIPAKRLYEAMKAGGVDAKLVIQKGSRHQFSEEPLDLKALL